MGAMKDLPPVPADRADELFARFRRTQESTAFGAFFDATSGELFELALRLAHDASAADDAVQETYLAVLDLAERHDPRRPVRPWLLGILRNKVREGRRREVRVARREAGASASSAVRPWS